MRRRADRQPSRTKQIDVCVYYFSNKETTMSHRSMSIKLLSLASLLGVLAFTASSVSMAGTKGAHHRASKSHVAGDRLRPLAGA